MERAVNREGEHAPQVYRLLPWPCPLWFVSCNPVLVYMRSLTNSIVMEVAVIIALGMQDWLDAGIIIGILLLNAVVGWYQEKQAADVVASLKGDIAMKAHVIRDGRETEIKARELVPGDIVSHILQLLYLLGINYNRSSLKKVTLSLVMPVLFANTITPRDKHNTRQSSQLKTSLRHAARSLRKVMVMTKEPLTLAMLSLLSTRVQSPANLSQLRST